MKIRMIIGWALVTALSVGLAPGLPAASASAAEKTYDMFVRSETLDRTRALKWYDATE